MKQYNVTGMSCAACSARVEKAVSNVPGVTACSVSLLTNSMGVEGTAAPADIVAAVEAAGYGASPKNAAAQSAAPSADALKDTETPRLKRRPVRPKQAFFHPCHLTKITSYPEQHEILPFPGQTPRCFDLKFPLILVNMCK